MAPKVAVSEQVQDDGLDRHQDAAEGGEQQHEGDDADDGERQGQPVEDGGLGVDELGRSAFDPELERGVEVTYVFDQGLTIGGAQAHVGHDGEPGASGGGVDGDVGDAFEGSHIIGEPRHLSLVGTVGGDVRQHDRKLFALVAGELGRERGGHLPGFVGFR